MRSKIAGGVAVVVVAVVAVVAGGWSGRQVDPFAARVARIANALDAHRDSGLLSLVEATGSGPEEKAVSRTDKNTFVFIGNVLAWDLDTLSDGTPITVLAMQNNKPFGQVVYLSCIGNLAFSCTGTGRRQFDGYMFAGDGESYEEYLFLAVATKVKR